MIRDITVGLSLKLDTLFGDSYAVHYEDIKQGLKGPCFFIQFLDSSTKSIIGTAKFRRHSFDILYFPKRPGSRAEMQCVAYDLVDGLEYITLQDGSLLRGTAIRYHITDGVLHFFIDYNLHTHVPQATTQMEEVQIETNGRE